MLYRNVSPDALEDRGELQCFVLFVESSPVIVSFHGRLMGLSFAEWSRRLPLRWLMLSVELAVD